MIHALPAFACSLLLSQVATSSDTVKLAQHQKPRVVALESGGGLDAPAGNWFLGLRLDLHRDVALAALIGEDVSGHHLRAALAARFRFLSYGPASLDAGPILSYMDGDESDNTRWVASYRLGAEAGITYRISPRFSLRGFGGVGTFLNRRPSYGNEPEQFENHPLVPHAGVSLNVALASLGERPADWRQPSRGWYGLPLLATDIAVLALWAAPLPQGANFYPLLASLTVAPMVVHSLAGHPGRAVVSVLLRFGVSVLGAAVGMTVVTSTRAPDEGDAFDGFTEGGLVGWLTAVLIDDLWLARSR